MHIQVVYIICPFDTLATIMDKATNPSPKRRGRKTTTLACDGCQKRKIRCVATTAGPGCAACTKSQDSCTYNNPTRRTFQKSFLIKTPEDHEIEDTRASTTQVSFKIPAAFDPWLDKLSPDEMQGLVHFFTVTEGPKKDLLLGMLPSLLKRSSPTEFRFLVHTLLSAASFLAEETNALPHSVGVSHYVSAVELLPTIAKGHVSVTIPLISLLDIVKDKLSA